jgi:hypothetical protein
VIRSVYTSNQETDALNQLARAHRLPVNTIVRLAIRKLAGLPVPEWADDLATEERVK